MQTDPNEEEGTDISINIPEIDPAAAQDAIGVALDNIGGITGADEGVSARVSGTGDGISEAPSAPTPDPEESASPPPPAAPSTPEEAERQAIAAGIAVTPEMVAAFKAENPLFASMDDATAGSALRDIIAHAVMESNRAGPAAQDAPGYSLWNDIKSIPGAIGAGVAKSGFETYDAFNELALGNDPSQHGEWRAGLENYYANTSGISGAAAVIAQFGAAFVGFGKFAKLAKIPGLRATATTRKGQIAQAAAKGAAADFIAFDGLEGRLSDLVQQYPALQNPVSEYLASKPDDTQAEGRLKNALEGFGIGMTVDVVLAGFRAMRAHRAGDKEAVEEAVDAAVTRFDELNAEGVTQSPQRPELRAANDDPSATPQTVDESSAPRRSPQDAPSPDNDTAAVIDRALLPPSLPREELEAAARRMAERVARDPAAPVITPEIGQAAPSTFDSLTRADDLRAVIDATEREILSGLEGSASARGVVPHEESQRLAKEFAEITGQDQGHFHARMSKDAGSIENLHARLLAYDQVTRTLAVEVRDMAHAIKRGEAGNFGSLDALKDAFENRLAAYAQVQDWLKGVRSETGRTLAIMRHSQSLGQSIDVSGISQVGQGRAPLAGNVTVDELVDAVITAGTNRKLLGDVASPTRYAQVRDALVSLFIKNILSGYTTQLVNMIGNVSAAIAHPATKIVGGAVTRDTTTMREGIKQYGFMLAESGHALNMAWEAYKRNINILDPSRSKFHADGKFPEALTANNITGGMVPDDSVTGWLANGVFKGLDAVSTRALSASDEFFKQTLYASELTARAWADGVAQGLNGDALKAYIKRQRDAGFTSAPDVGENTANIAGGGANAEAALEVARFNTFTQNVKPGGLASGILYWTNRYPELKFAVPFVRVVANLMSYTGTMTPLVAQRMAAYKDAIARGGRDAAVAKGRLAMGYALWSTAMGMAASGQLTGAGPVKSDGSPDYKKRQLLQQTGWKPNSLKIGNTYIDLSRMDPIGLPFNLAAQAYERFQMGLRDEKSWEDITASMAFSLGHVILDRQYMKGLADLFEAMNDDSGNKAIALVSNITSSLAVPNFVRQAVTIQNDPLMREARGVVESILRRTPFASENLAARRMPWGQKMELQPSLYNVESDDPLMREYARLLESGDSGAGEPLPRTKAVPGGKSIDMATFRLSTGETLYDAYGDLIEQPDPSVPPLTQVLRDLIASPEYQNEMIDGAGTFKGTRLKAWQTIMARYRAAAWRKILDTYPEVRERVYQKKLTTAEQAAAQKRAVEMEAFLNE